MRTPDYQPPHDAPPEEIVVSALSFLIAQSLHSFEAQRHYPDMNPDSMDAKIKFSETRVARLRKMREEFENEMARPLEGDR